jgi:alkanesulfonate monooxygenase SsuD/methylene tetrahydromethanopterin reductase-like flavin-dependent oxidoreductase (luciferase family)
VITDLPQIPLMAYLRAHDDLYYGKILELRQVVAPTIAYQRTRYAEWGTDRDKPKPEPISSEDLPWERYLVGTPDEVTEGLLGLYQEAPYDHLCFWDRLPGVTHQQALENMRLFAAEVAPKVREAVETA